MEDNQVEVEILTQTITSQYGTLSQGDRLRTSPEFARHLVKDAGAAKYTNAADDTEAQQGDADPAMPRKSGEPDPAPAPAKAAGKGSRS